LVQSPTMRPDRLVIPRLPEGSVAPPGDAARVVDPPALAGVRLVFGVGSSPTSIPGPADFHPVYTVSMPVFSPGGLDPDGIYEFDAGAQLELLQSRATRRRWGVRLELELAQASEAVNAADLWIEAPWSEGEVALMALGSARGEPAVGGGRRVTVASTPVTDVALARRLGGSFRVQLCDVDPHLAGGRATVQSAVFEVALDLGCYEFETETETETE